MNETIKVILIFIAGAVFGGVSSLFIRNIVSRSIQNRVGTDTNVIGEVTSGIGDATSTVESIQTGISNIEETAGKITDASGALASVIRKIEERQQSIGTKE